MSTFITFFQNPSHYWIRWVLLLPLAVITYVLISPLVKIIFELPLLILDFGEWYRRFIVAGIAGLAAGNSTIGTVALVTPVGKKNTCFIFLILIAVSIGAVIFTGYTNPDYSPITENIAVIFGASFSYLNIDKDGNLIDE